MRRMPIGPLGLVLAAALAAAASGQEPASEAEPDALFRTQCGGCHLENGFGTRVLARRTSADQAMLERRDQLPAELVRLAVRRGVGSMPPIRRTELSDRDLDRIAHYLENAK